MSKKTMLAAVHSAVNSEALTTDTDIDESPAALDAETVEQADEAFDGAGDHSADDDMPEDGDDGGDDGDGEEQLADTRLTRDQMAAVNDWSDHETGCFAAGVEHERSRLAAIEDATLPGHEELAADAKFNTPVTLTEFLQMQTSAEKSLRKSRRDALDSDESAVSGLRSTHRTANPSGQPQPQARTREERWLAEWNASSRLQAEFAEAGDFIAFKKRDVAGK